MVEKGQSLIVQFSGALSNNQEVVEFLKINLPNQPSIDNNQMGFKQSQLNLILTAPLRNSPEMSSCTHKALNSKKPTKMTHKYKGFLQ